MTEGANDEPEEVSRRSRAFLWDSFVTEDADGKPEEVLRRSRAFSWDSFVTEDANSEPEEVSEDTKPLEVKQQLGPGAQQSQEGKAAWSPHSEPNAQ